MTKKADSAQRLFTKNCKEIEAAMVDECGYKYCQYCYRSNGHFERHHIIYRSEKPAHPKLNDKENALILCAICHINFHYKKAMRNDIVKERGLDKIFGQDVLDK